MTELRIIIAGLILTALAGLYSIKHETNKKAFQIWRKGLIYTPEDYKFQMLQEKNKNDPLYGLDL